MTRLFLVLRHVWTCKISQVLELIGVNYVFFVIYTYIIFFVCVLW